MYNISNTNGPVSFCEASGKAGDFTITSKGKAFNQDLIRSANSVPIINVFRRYGIRINDCKSKIICPFKSHKDGRETTASFLYYPETNSYHCFGCRVGSHACDFVSEMDRISKSDAATKIIGWFGAFVNEDAVIVAESLSERIEIMMDFSNTVREFRKSVFDEKSFEYIENVCLVYDTVYAKHNTKYKTMSNETLRIFVNKLKSDIVLYKP